MPKEGRFPLSWLIVGHFLSERCCCFLVIVALITLVLVKPRAELSNLLFSLFTALKPFSLPVRSLKLPAKPLFPNVKLIYTKCNQCPMIHCFSSSQHAYSQVTDVFVVHFLACQSFGSHWQAVGLRETHNPGCRNRLHT